MERNTSRILAVNPGSRYVGIAVFAGEELLDWRVSSLGRKSPRIRKETYARLLSAFKERYEITATVIKGLQPSKTSPLLQELVVSTKRWATNNRLPLNEYALAEIKETLGIDKKHNKNRLMDVVASRYPFLRSQYHKQTQSRQPYLVRMFEAVALGMALQAQNVS